MTVIRLADRLTTLELRRAPVPARGLVEAERHLIALAAEAGVDAGDPEQLMALLDAMIERLATERRR